jgi:hypothetical protein
MRPLNRQSLLAACCLGLCLVGCSEKSAIQKQVRDPLLISKKPVEGRPTSGSPDPPAYAELSPPVVPETAVATAPVSREALGLKRIEHAEEGPTKPTVTAVPAVRSGAGSAPAETVSRRGPASIHDHAPDHNWLQGVLVKHYLGHWELRYCDAGEDDEWGGKVILEEDSRLGRFQEGDIVRVEGEIVTEDGKAKRGAWNHFVHYRIKEIRLVQGK